MAAIAVLAVAAACDDDPTSTVVPLTVTCPTGVQGVNSPIALTFSRPISAATAAGGNVIVTSAATGLEIPGSLGASGGNMITFTPSSPLPFDTEIRVRVQNVLSEPPDAQVAVTVCELTTELPPITQLYWFALPPATGTRLVGGSLIGEDSGYVASLAGPIFRRTGTDFVVAFNEPFYAGTNDVAFVSPSVGFASTFNNREFHAVLQRTNNGGVTWDSVNFTQFETVNRLYFVPRAGTAPNNIFGVLGGGTSFSARIQRYNPATHALTTVLDDVGSTANVTDLDFTDNLRFGAASTFGIRFSAVSLGKLFVTADTGNTWTEVVSGRANTTTVLYMGVAIKENCEVFLAGGSGTFVRLTPSACGAAYGAPDTITVQELGLTNPDPSDPNALLFTDVEFAPGNNNLGWVIGAQQVGLVGGEPRYQGFIFETTDGGATWTRQGVPDAGNFGAEFARLNRIIVRAGPTVNEPFVWLAGDAGTVLSYRRPQSTTP